MLENKVIVLTGGLGFIGGHLANYFINKGAKVYILDKFDKDCPRHLYNYKVLKHKNYERNFIELDITNGRIYKNIANKLPSAIYYTIHLAALTGVRSDIDSGLYFQTNVYGTKNTIKYLALKSQHFINFSSSNIYGNCKALKITENEKRIPINIYGYSKMFAEMACEKLFNDSIKSSNLKSITTLRPFNIYGTNYKECMVVFHKYF